MDNASVTNDFSYLNKTDKVTYKMNADRTQFLTIQLGDGYKIEIVVPNGIFEWFVDVKDPSNNILISDWDECYEGIKIERSDCRQQSIDDFVQKALRHETRIVPNSQSRKRPNQLEVLIGNTWTVLI